MTLRCCRAVDKTDFYAEALLSAAFKASPPATGLAILRSTA